MKVFLSWSGDRSKALAHALNEFLPSVIQSLETFMSASAILAGTQWGPKLSSELDTTDFGILCLTPENLKAEWILFEAGALSKRVGAAFVCPCLLDMKPSDIGFPLAQFQAKEATRDGLWDIVKAANGAMKERLDEKRLENTFGKFYGDLQDKIKAIPAPSERPEVHREDREVLDEILEHVRSANSTGLLSRYQAAATETVFRLREIKERCELILAKPDEHRSGFADIARRFGETISHHERWLPADLLGSLDGLHSALVHGSPESPGGIAQRRQEVAESLLPSISEFIEELRSRLT